jgi:uncharacterized protein DUF4129
VRPWNWLHNVAVPVVLAVAEATWVSLCLSAIVNGSGRFHMDLPYLAFALPAATAACLVGLSGRLSWRWWQRGIALAPLVVLGTALTAGLVSELSVPGSFAAVALHPWTVVGRVPSETAAIAWLVASLTWLRGTWLGARPITFTHAAWSVAVSVLAFVVLFLVLAADHHPAAHLATPLAAVLFIIFFAGSIAVLALVRERDVEVEAQGRSNSRPSGAWLTVLAIPLLGVAGVALVVALVVGPLAPLVGRAVERAALAIGAAIAWLVRAIGDLFGKSHPTPTTTTVRGGPTGGFRPAPKRLPAAPVHVPTWIGVVVALVVVVGGVILLVRWLTPRLARRRTATPVIDEERDSVFTWVHLRDQVLALLRRLFTRRRRRSSGTDEPREPVVTLAGSDEAGIRAQYRRLLAAARQSQIGRAQSETTREFEHRLASTVGPDGAIGELDQLTRLYDRVRYGDLPDTAEERAIARRDVDELVEVVRRHTAPEPEILQPGQPEAKPQIPV